MLLRSAWTSVALGTSVIEFQIMSVRWRGI
jgi:hypothetical protein